jgi:GC-rich sequence DNA-binding factor
MLAHTVPVPSLTEIPSLEGSVNRISHIMTSISTSHVQDTASISTISVELAQLEVYETDLWESITSTEEKRSWFANFREWLESVVTFLDEKVRSLESFLFPIFDLSSPSFLK